MLANVSGFFVNNHLRRKNIVGRSLLSSSKTNTSLTMSAFDSSVEPGTCDAELLQQRQAAVASKFKIVTCTSTSCAKKRANLNLDEYATFGAFYERTSDSPVSVEESPCLGSCQKAPCVGIEHEDYEGTVALEGMTADEFSASCFHRYVPVFCLIILCYIADSWYIV